jgi:hypothetical protein
VKPAAFAALVEAGFALHRRGRYWWLRYPDGFDSEVVPVDAIANEADVEALVERLLPLARKRGQAVHAVRQALGRGGWGIDLEPSGRWAIGRGGCTSQVDVGWALTEVLRDATVRAALAQRFRDYSDFFFPDGALDVLPDAAPFDNDALLAAHRQVMADIDANSIDIGSETGPYHDEVSRTVEAELAARRARARTRALPEGEGADDAAFAAWARRTLQLRRDLVLAGEVGCLWRLCHSPWLVADDWFDLESLVIACRRRVAEDPWDTPAAELLALHDPGQGHAAALAFWDRWQAEGGYDQCGDDLAPFIHADRADARDVVFEPGYGRTRVVNAMRAGFANVLHEVRAGIEAAWAMWKGTRELVPADEDDDEDFDPAWAGFCQLVELLRNAGPQAAPALLDPAEAKALVAEMRAVIAAPHPSAWALLGEIIVVAAWCGWTEVADAVFAQPHAQDLVIDPMPGIEWARPNVADGLLGLSLLAPGPDCEALARRAWLSLPPDRVGDREQDDLLAVAIAWHRCQP